jgi:hypothetical protein
LDLWVKSETFPSSTISLWHSLLSHSQESIANATIDKEIQMLHDRYADEYRHKPPAMDDYFSLSSSSKLNENVDDKDASALDSSFEVWGTVDR